jgi:hypothetical protein
MDITKSNLQRITKETDVILDLVKSFHIFVADFKVENVKVLFDSRGIYRFGNDANLLLDQMTKQNLKLNKSLF